MGSADNSRMTRLELHVTFPAINTEVTFGLNTVHRHIKHLLYALNSIKKHYFNINIR